MIQTMTTIAMIVLTLTPMRPLHDHDNAAHDRDGQPDHDKDAAAAHDHNHDDASLHAANGHRTRSPRRR